MSRKKRVLVVLGILVAVALVSTVSILAASSYGSQNDPLVTLGYLNNKFKPAVVQEVGTKTASEEKSLEDKLAAQVNTFEADVKSALASANVDADTFAVITLSKDQTISCTIGAEIMLRDGTATCSAAMTNTTAGTTVAAGGAIAANNMYMASSEGGGMKATSDTVTVLVRGDYTVS